MKHRGFPVSLVAIASLATFLSNLSAGITNVPLADVGSALGGGLGAGGYALVAIVLSYLVPYAVVMPVVGKLGDHYGHKRVFLGGLGLYVLGSLAAAASPDAAALIASRAVQGLGGGVILDSIVFISAGVRQGQGLAFGVWRAALLSGTVGGPVIGGYLSVLLGWRSLMWLPALPAALLWLWAAVALDELPRSDEVVDWVGSVLFLAGFSAVVVALSASGMDTMQAGLAAATGRIMHAMAWMLYGFFGVAMALLWIHQKTDKRPLFDLSLYRIRPFVLGNLGTWLVCVGMFSAMMFVPLQLQYVEGYTALFATHALLPLALTAIVVGVWGGRIADRLGPLPPWVAGFALMAASFVALALLGSHPSQPALLAVMTAAGFGMALPLAPTALTALGHVPEAAAGEAAGLFNFAHNMGRAVGLGLLGALLVLREPSSYAAIYGINAALMAAGAALPLALRTRKATRGAHSL